MFIYKCFFFFGRMGSGWFSNALFLPYQCVGGRGKGWDLVRGHGVYI